MHLSNIAITAIVVIGLGTVATDRFVVQKMQAEYKELEKERLDITNRLATAKIVQENLNHVNDLMTKNMVSAGENSAENHESELFKFITESVNNLKIKLVATRPIRPVTEGELTTYGYELEFEADFFKLGELCAQFENSRRIISIEEFDVIQLNDVTTSAGTQNVRVTMKIHSYLIHRKAS